MDLDFYKSMSIIALPFVLLINGFLLHSRKKKWVKSKYKWYFVILLSLVGMSLYVFNFKVNSTSMILFEWMLITPLVYALIDFLFMKFSYFIHDRDFYLWTRFSDEIDTRKFGGGKKVKGTDRILTMLLIFINVFLPFFVFAIIDYLKH